MKDQEKVKETEEKTEEQPLEPLEIVSRLMSMYAAMMRNHITRSEKITRADKLGALEIAAFVMSQAHAMVIDRITGWEEATVLPTSPVTLRNSMITAQIIARTMLDEIPEPERAEPEPSKILGLDGKPMDSEAPKVLAPGRANNRKARRAKGRKK